MRTTYNNAYNEILNDAEAGAFDFMNHEKAFEIVEGLVPDTTSDLAHLFVQYCHGKKNDDYAFLHTYFDELALRHAALEAEKHYQQALDFGSLREDN